MAGQLFLSSRRGPRVRARMLAALALSTIALSGCTVSTAATAFDELPPPEIPVLSGERADALLDEAREAAWDTVHSEFPDQQRPEVELIRIVPQNEWANAMVECMTGAGFSATAGEDGGFESTFTETLAQTHALALYVCRVSYPVDPRYKVPLNGSQLKYLFAYYRDVLAPCLDERGVEVSAAPSEQTFVDSYYSDPWSPYAGVRPPTEKEWLQLLRECPQYPAALYGG